MTCSLCRRVKHTTPTTKIIIPMKQPTTIPMIAPIDSFADESLLAADAAAAAGDELRVWVELGEATVTTTVCADTPTVREEGLMPAAVAAADANDEKAEATLAVPPLPVLLWLTPDEKFAAVAFRRGPRRDNIPVIPALASGEDTEVGTRTDTAREATVEDASASVNRRKSPYCTRIKRRAGLLASQGGRPSTVAVLTALEADTDATRVSEALTNVVEEMVTSESGTSAIHARPARRRTPTAGVVTTAGVMPPLSSTPTPTCKQK